MNRKVMSANFHQAVFLAGIGSIGNAIPVSNRADSRDWGMVTNDTGILITAKGRDYIVPWANVAGAALGESVSQESKSA